MRRSLWMLVLAVGCSVSPEPHGRRGAVVEPPADIGHALVLQLGKLHYEVFEYREALELFRRAAALNPEHRETQHLKELVSILCGVQPIGGGKPPAQQAREIQRMYDLGRRLEASGHPYRAMWLYQRVLVAIRYFPFPLWTDLQGPTRERLAAAMGRWGVPVETELLDLWDLGN